MTIFLLFFMVCLSVVVVVACALGSRTPAKTVGASVLVGAVRLVVGSYADSGGAIETVWAAGGGAAVAFCGVE